MAFMQFSRLVEKNDIAKAAQMGISCSAQEAAGIVDKTLNEKISLRRIFSYFVENEKASDAEAFIKNIFNQTTHSGAWEIKREDKKKVDSEDEAKNPSWIREVHKMVKGYVWEHSDSASLYQDVTLTYWKKQACVVLATLLGNEGYSDLDREDVLDQIKTSGSGYFSTLDTLGRLFQREAEIEMSKVKFPSLEDLKEFPLLRHSKVKPKKGSMENPVEEE